jgi:prophage maintenance system killer protein
VFLEINDVSVEAASNDDVCALVMEVAQAQLALDDIAERLRHLVD